MSVTTPCPCCSGDLLIRCCDPLLRGSQFASTALALMRSRYTAFVLGNIEYLLATWHPSTKPAGIDPDTIPEYCDLRIIRTEKGLEGDATGIVEFQATALAGAKKWFLCEISNFVREDGRWFYVNGLVPQAEQWDAKPGRNAPCPCGSGKKFKKCCGQAA